LDDRGGSQYSQLFCCPECHGKLILKENSLECISCSCSFPFVDNIPLFSNLDTYYGELEKNDMSQLLEIAEKKGYKKAVQKYFQDKFNLAYVLDESRAKWIDIVPHDKNSRILDLGCGWGTTSIPISKQVRSLVALDATYQRVKFVQIRTQELHLDNITPVLASAVKLPFPDQSFDIVTFNGVLEWVGAADKSIDPMILQKKALLEAHRVLKPGGVVYIGIENRFSLYYFFGIPDDHSFLRFTSLLPRKLADLYCKIRTGEKYFTHIHSLNVYIRMLTSTGFSSSNIRTFLPWPTYRTPEYIVPMEYAEIKGLIKKLLYKQNRIFKQIFLRIILFITAIERKGAFMHAFCFVAKKDLGH
jgi:2-polyprenyl-3-methyl-5-hydroxy-6-metoxy-1,4-benzoquinol methylase